MSATIYWIPVTRTHKVVSVALPSRFVDTMQRAFGSAPWSLNNNARLILCGTEACADGNEAAYGALLEYIDRHDTIEVTVEY